MTVPELTCVRPASLINVVIIFELLAFCLKSSSSSSVWTFNTIFGWPIRSQWWATLWFESRALWKQLTAACAAWAAILPLFWCKNKNLSISRDYFYGYEFITFCES